MHELPYEASPSLYLHRAGSWRLNLAKLGKQVEAIATLHWPA